MSRHARRHVESGQCSLTSQPEPVRVDDGGRVRGRHVHEVSGHVVSMRARTSLAGRSVARDHVLMRTFRMLMGLLLVASLASAAPHASASGPLPPDRDPFYRYSGGAPLTDVTPGTVLKSRSVQVALGTTTTPLSAEQLLYRTTD